MKQLRIYFQTVLLLIFFQSAFGQEITQKDNAKEAAIEKMIDSKRFVFKAQFALPMRGSSRQLTSEYDLKVSDEKVVAYLPYFGRAFSAPMNPSEGGIKFTSSDFDYKSKEKKKGGWEILIKPNDTRSVRKLFLSVSTAGYATLRVLSNNKDAISYNGYIQNLN